MKDAKGHGSNTGTQGMRLVKTHVLGPHSAKVYNNPEWGEKVVKTFRDGVYQPKNDYHTSDLADAHGTAMSQLNRWSDQGAKASLASGPKSAPAPVHDSMASQTPQTDALMPRLSAALGSSYNEHGSRHGYSPDAVNNAIAAQNRSGRGKIGGREASMIHRLLKGR